MAIKFQIIFMAIKFGVLPIVDHFAMVIFDKCLFPLLDKRN